MAKQFDRDLKKYERQLAAFLSPDKVHEDLVAHHGADIINSVIGSAKAGIAPGNKPYAPYSKSYRKQLGGRASGKLWLVGGDKPVMLDRKRFNWIIKARTGQLFLEWTGPVYGPVHQGDTYGGKSDTRGNIPERPFVHFANSANRGSVDTSYRLTLERRTAKFNAGNLK